jgi:hypothetical protein
MTDFAAYVEHHLQLADIPFDRGDLIAFLEANRPLADCEPDAGQWASRFAAYLREQAASAVEWH